MVCPVCGYTKASPMYPFGSLLCSKCGFDEDFHDKDTYEAEKIKKEENRLKKKRYRKKWLIEAQPYALGLEDGFIEESDGCSIPYMDTPDGRVFIEKTDYIVTEMNGKRYSCKKDIFEEYYEEIKES